MHPKALTDLKNSLYYSLALKINFWKAKSYSLEHKKENWSTGQME